MCNFLRILVFTAIAPALSLGSVTIVFQAGVLRDAAGDPLAIDSKAILVADTSAGQLGFVGDYVNGTSDFGAFDGTSLSIGSPLGSNPDNVILFVFEVEDLTGDGDSGIDGTFTFEVDGSPFESGQSLGLYWFPFITGNSISGNVAEYGFYRTDAVDTASESTISFNIPADASTDTLGVFDENFGGGASVSSLTAVPEPRFAGVVVGLLALGISFRLRQRKN